MLNFRWQVASGGGQHPFAEDAISLIFEAAAGRPREANIIADNSLVAAYLNQQRTITREVVAAVVADRHHNLDRKEAA